MSQVVADACRMQARTCIRRPRAQCVPGNRRVCHSRDHFRLDLPRLPPAINQAASQLARAPQIWCRNHAPPALKHRHFRALHLTATTACSLARSAICAPFTIRRPPAIDLRRCRYRAPGCGLPRRVVPNHGAARGGKGISDAPERTCKTGREKWRMDPV